MGIEEIVVESQRKRNEFQSDMFDPQLLETGIESSSYGRVDLVCMRYYVCVCLYGLPTIFSDCLEYFGFKILASFFGLYL